MNDTALLELAFETSLYIFLFLFILAAFFVFWFVRWITSGRNPLAYFPQTGLPESKVLAAAKMLVGTIKYAQKKASDEELETIQADHERASGLVEIIQNRLTEEQATCKNSCDRRERLWKEIYWLVQNLTLWEKIRGLRNHEQYQEMLQEYEELEDTITKERQHLKTLDKLHMQELQNHFLYKQYQ